MKNLRARLVKQLHHQRLSKSSGTIAGFAGALSVIVGFLAARAAPRGLAKLPMMLHLSSKPLIVKLAPIIAGLAVAAGTAAGIIKFYSWCVEHEDDPAAPERNDDE